jgi:3',5'-nucleoside bisphosphate phosphatase
LQLSIDAVERFVDELVAAGLRGIEGYHGDFTLDEQEPLRAIGKSRDLIVSGGSDYHGAMRPDRSLPGGKHGVVVPDAVVEELRAAAGALQEA